MERVQMLTINRARSLDVLAFLFATGTIAGWPLGAQPRGPVGPRIPAPALAEARARGNTRVIVSLDVGFTPEPLLSASRALSQRAAIARAQGIVLGRMLRVNPSSVRRFTYIPFVALEVDEPGLQTLAASPEVKGIEIDAVAAPTLAESTPLIGATQAWAAGYTGAGWAVAVLDTGVDSTHPFLAGKVVSEGCYSTTSSSMVGLRTSSLCPGGAASSTITGSAAPCAMLECAHGTHVAGIAAGKGTGFSGVARDATLIAVQVFSSFVTSSDCGSHPLPCALSFTSDQILGLERIYTLRTTYNIAAVNMSLGGGLFVSPCDSNSTKTIIDQLRAAGIATVIASGNDGSTMAISAPACISTSISVGSSTDGSSGLQADQVSFFSNSNQFLSLLAPGETILSSVPGGGFSNFNGTSMAAPHVAGAWAILKSRNPSATVDDVLGALTATGTPVLDPGNGLTKPRINVDLALQALPATCSYVATPSQLTAGPLAAMATVTVTTAANCSWTATSMSPFVTVSSGQSGTGPGSVGLSLQVNTSHSARDGFVSIAGSTVTITQQGRPSPPDINADGRADIVWQHQTEGWLATWYMDTWTVVGTTLLGINRVADVNWKVVGSGDLNGDGNVDLVWQHQTEGWLAVWYLAGAQVISSQFLSTNRVADLNWKVKGVADLDGDGKADLIWQHQTEGWLGAWFMNGAQVVEMRLLSTERAADPHWKIVGAGDTNGDGKADLIWQHETEGWVAAWTMNGVQIMSTQFLSINREADPAWRIRAVGDINDDGRADLIWQNDVTGELKAWLMDGIVVLDTRFLSIDHVSDLNWRVVGPG